MATINLGAIKFNWKGAYNSSTTYAVDDVVSSGGNSYVCIQAHSNQAVGNATAYWNIMSSAGSNGTDGTDVGTTITTQGDILYRDGSGLARLGAGTSGYYLKTQGASANPVWSEVSAGSHTKIAEFTSSGTPTYWALDNIFTSTYDFYMIYLTNYLHVDSNLQWYVRLRTGGASGSNDNNSSYRFMVYKNQRTSGTEANSGDGGWDTNHYRIANYDLSDDTNKGSFCQLYISNPYNNDRMTSFIHHALVNQSDMTAVNYTNGACVFNNNTSHTGISFSAQDSSNKIANGNKAFVYGIKY